MSYRKCSNLLTQPGFGGLVAWEEADGTGLFLDHIVDPDDVSFFAQRYR